MRLGGGGILLLSSARWVCELVELSTLGVVDGVDGRGCIMRLAPWSFRLSS